MPLTDLLMLVAIVGYLGFCAISYILLVAERLGEILWPYHPYKAQAAKDSPEPLPLAMSYMDIALLGLSPDMRAEFLSLEDDPQRSSITPLVNGSPSRGSLTK